MVKRAFVSAFAFAMFSTLPGYAQEFGRIGDIEYSGTSYHVFARPGEATVQVLVMGPGGGIYEVGEATRLDELFALIGGGGMQSGIGDEAEVLTSVLLYRDQNSARSLVYEAEIEQMLLEPRAYPTLQDGDVFVIESRPKKTFTWRDGLSLLTGISALLLVTERLTRRL